MAVEVRRALPDDAAAIAVVHVRAWQAAYRGLMPDKLLDELSVADREAMWRQILTSADATAVYVAVRERTVIGFCATAAPSRDADATDGVAEVGAIYVDPDAWRAGVGRQLMDAALAALRAGGWQWVTLWVLAENEQAREFYARLEFEHDGAEATEERSGRTEVRLRRSLRA